jgi:hypothetical protein
MKKKIYIYLNDKYEVYHMDQQYPTKDTLIMNITISDDRDIITMIDIIQETIECVLFKLNNDYGNNNTSNKDTN